MRWLRLVTLLSLIVGSTLVARPMTIVTASDSSAVSFEKDVAPIVGRCQPCHFQGGTMYARLPFDRAQTIRTLGTRLFTRIKDEKERSIVRRFLAMKPEIDAKETPSPQPDGR